MTIPIFTVPPTNVKITLTAGTRRAGYVLASK